jgi:hypothetical protein
VRVDIGLALRASIGAEVIEFTSLPGNFRRLDRVHRRAASASLAVWSHGILVHCIMISRGASYGANSSPQRHNEAIRRAIQNSQASLRELPVRYGINPKTVAKWRRRDSVCDARMRPREPHSTILSKEEEALIVAFRKHTLPPLDDCLYTLQATIPHLTRSSLHRCLQRHGINRLPETQGDKPAKRKFKCYPIGYFHLDNQLLQSLNRSRTLQNSYRAHR